MTTAFRYLTAAALLATLAACGNKGPLVQASQALPVEVAPAPASPPSTDPTDVAPPEQIPAPSTAPPSASPPATPPATGGGNG